MRARLLIGTGEGNLTRPGTDAIDVTNVASLIPDYQGDIGATANAGVASQSVISANNLESFYFNLRDGYNGVRNSAVLIDVTVCHSSCHASCHSARGRR